ncbi:hypothetical protein EC991_005231 [Linnemannia zychae]|nr:hypothetical protein EC991_005231 [Linnemannia zychae]
MAPPKNHRNSNKCNDVDSSNSVNDSITKISKGEVASKDGRDNMQSDGVFRVQKGKKRSSPMYDRSPQSKRNDCQQEHPKSNQSSSNNTNNWDNYYRILCDYNDDDGADVPSSPPSGNETSKPSLPLPVGSLPEFTPGNGRGTGAGTNQKYPASKLPGCRNGVNVVDVDVTTAESVTAVRAVSKCENPFTSHTYSSHKRQKLINDNGNTHNPTRSKENSVFLEYACEKLPVPSEYRYSDTDTETRTSSCINSPGSLPDPPIGEFDPTNENHWINPTTMVIKSKYPKAFIHLLVIPYGRKFSTMSCLIREEDGVEVVRQLHQRAEILVARETMRHPGIKFVIGFHVLPSQRQIHLHVVSTDFCGIKSLRSFNKYNTGYFMSPEQVISKIRERRNAHNFDFLSPGEKVAFKSMLSAEPQCLECLPNCISHPRDSSPNDFECGGGHDHAYNYENKSGDSSILQKIPILDLSLYFTSELSPMNPGVRPSTKRRSKKSAFKELQRHRQTQHHYDYVKKDLILPSRHRHSLNSYEHFYDSPYSDQETDDYDQEYDCIPEEFDHRKHERKRNNATRVASVPANVHIPRSRALQHAATGHPRS